ncbi:MAG: TraR/DksA C4-type zinc finger protein [Nitrospirota bacterium]
MAKKTAKKTSKKTIKSIARKTPQGTKIKTGQKRNIAKTKAKASVTKKLRSKKAEDERKAALRRALINRREEIVKETKVEISKYIKGETKQLIDTALDNGDWSIVDLSEDVSLRQLSTHRKTLLKIDEALRKLDESTYGRCEDCGEEISEERLKVLPFAIYCTECQEKREQLEEIEKEAIE